MRISQQKFFKNSSLSYGGILLNTRAGRAFGRPLSTRDTMHLVVHSTQARGEWSFKKKEKAISHLSLKFAKRYGVKICSFANVGSHLHFHLKLSNRFTYAAFIRALTGAIAMLVTGKTRWSTEEGKEKKKFWDHRPFTRIVKGFKDFLNVEHYVELNVLEGMGYTKPEARFILENLKPPPIEDY